MAPYVERPELDDVAVWVGDVQRAAAVGIFESDDLRLVAMQAQALDCRVEVRIVDVHGKVDVHAAAPLGDPDLRSPEPDARSGSGHHPDRVAVCPAQDHGKAEHPCVEALGSVEVEHLEDELAHSGDRDPVRHAATSFAGTVAEVNERELLHRTADHAADFIETLGERPIRAEVGVDELIAALGGPLPEAGTEDDAVVDSLVEAAEPGLVGMASGRYFGFVIGGAVPAALAADWLTSAWDQNPGLYAAGPAAAVAEEVARGWLAELLGLPPDVSVAYVTGCQMAHVTALAAARHHVLAQAGWDVAAEGLAGSPPIRVVVGAKRHVTIDRALRLLGIGANALHVVPADDQGRMLVGELPDLGGAPTIVCGQAGEVNTGAFDEFDAIADAAEAGEAWFHLDGAFGLWAAASPELAELMRGGDRADSWATDAHKWLNVPYDSGIAFCAHEDAHRAAMSVTASYLVQAKDGRMRDSVDWTPEFSRRARGFPIYAAIRSLGRSGIADLVERCCANARLFGELLEAGGATILNDVVLNQVLVRFGDGEETRAVIARVQQEGTCWLGGTDWLGEHAMRISVSNWRTTADDIERSAAAVLAAAGVHA
jgi:glutamate/tyrosine decarboxylase-like PLP-dependent enzyme